VHRLRYRLDVASWTERKALAAALKPICTALDAETAEAALEAFAAGPWGQQVPPIVASGRLN
jgi:putative transposase